MSQVWATEVLIEMLILGVAWCCYNRRVSAGKTHVATPAPRTGKAAQADGRKQDSAMQFFQEFSDGIDHAEGEMGCSSDRDSKARESASVHVGYDEPGVDGLGPSEPEVAESLEFAFDSHRFKISERRWRGPNDEIHAEFSFFEDGTKSFAIRCLVSVDAQGVRYEGCEVATFDTRVNWAKALLGFHANALFERDRASADFRHLRADGIGHGPG